MAPTLRGGLLRGLVLAAAVAVLLGGRAALRHVLLHSPRFALRELRLVTAPGGHVSEEQLREHCGLNQGESLFAINVRASELRLMGALPWLRAVKVHRELPGRVVIEAQEHEAAALIALDSLYLVDRRGQVFKRASPEETAGLAVLTGLSRELYSENVASIEDVIRQALQVAALYQEPAPQRPPLGEIHYDHFDGFTLYTAGGSALRLGFGEPQQLRERLARFDLVLRDLSHNNQKIHTVFLDNQAHPDLVTVRLLQPPPPTP